MTAGLSRVFYIGIRYTSLFFRDGNAALNYLFGSAAPTIGTLRLLITAIYTRAWSLRVAGLALGHLF